jgi:hypothetical protein
MGEGRGDSGVPDGIMNSKEPNIVEDIKIRIIEQAGHIIRVEEERIKKKF